MYTWPASVFSSCDWYPVIMYNRVGDSGSMYQACIGEVPGVGLVYEEQKSSDVEISWRKSGESAEYPCLSVQCQILRMGEGIPEGRKFWR